jgi:hypothetical protein
LSSNLFLTISSTSGGSSVSHLPVHCRVIVNSSSSFVSTLSSCNLRMSGLR